MKGQGIKPQDGIQVLRVIKDTRLKYRGDMARVGSEGLEAVLELKRLKGLSPTIARQSFTSTVATVMDYASNVWMHECHYRAASSIPRVQRIEAQAVVGTFMSVAMSVAEAEARIASAQERFWRKAIKMWTDIHRLPGTHPLGRNISRIRKFRRYHRSPFYQVADMLKDVSMEHRETINPFTLAPWERRVEAITDESGSDTN